MQFPFKYNDRSNTNLLLNNIDKFMPSQTVLMQFPNIFVERLDVKKFKSYIQIHLLDGGPLLGSVN